METRNATIKSTFLGYEDHQILTCFLNLDYGDSGQSFGGYALDAYDKDKDDRVATVACGTWIKEILEVVELKSWEKLPGTHIRVKQDNGRVYAIGHLLKDKWFEPTSK
jgi:hypothetical protein